MTIINESSRQSAVLGGDISSMSDLEIAVRDVLRPVILIEHLATQCLREATEYVGVPGNVCHCPVSEFVADKLCQRGYDPAMIHVETTYEYLLVSTWSDSETGLNTQVRLDTRENPYLWVREYVDAIDATPVPHLVSTEFDNYIMASLAFSKLQGVLFA